MTLVCFDVSVGLVRPASKVRNFGSSAKDEPIQLALRVGSVHDELLLYIRVISAQLAETSISFIRPYLFRKQLIIRPVIRSPRNCITNTTRHDKHHRTGGAVKNSSRPSKEKQTFFFFWEEKKKTLSSYLFLPAKTHQAGPKS